MDKSRVSKITSIVCIPLIGFAVIRFIFQGIKVENKNLVLIPGLIIIDLSLICGYLYSIFLILIKKIKLKI